MIRVEFAAETVAELTSQVRALLLELEPPIKVRAGRPGAGRLRSGQANKNAKHTDDEVRAMLARAKEIGVYKAAIELGVNPSWLSRVHNGHIWKHITEAAA